MDNRRVFFIFAILNTVASGIVLTISGFATIPFTSSNFSALGQNAVYFALRLVPSFFYFYILAMNYDRLIKALENLVKKWSAKNE